MTCQFLVAAVVVSSVVAGACAQAPSSPATQPAAHGPDILRTPTTEQILRHRFSDDDERLLDEIQRTCHHYFWNAVGQPAGLVRDRLKAPIASVAAVGFQLAALPVAVERKWIAHAEGRERAESILLALYDRTDNKTYGMYLHFPDHNTGGRSAEAWTSEISTVDTALLLCGGMVAASYFKGETAALVDKMLAEANWKRFAVAEGGFIAMAVDPADPSDPNSGKAFSKASWWNSGSEEHLVYFLAIGSPTPDHAMPPEWWYKLGRTVKAWKDGPPFVVNVNGSLFNYFFAHCYIDFRGFEADDPSRFGLTGPRVDWFENSRRAILTHRARNIELADRYKTLSAERWGLSACVGREGYIVPELAPSTMDVDNAFEGTIAPYAAGSSIPLTPAESLAALRAFRHLKTPGGKPVWTDPADGGYGLWDAFNLDQDYVSDDIVGIDHGPMLLAIENARTGLVWKLFMEHPLARRAVERMRWQTRQ